MTRLQEIEARIAELEGLTARDDANIEEIRQEFDALVEERKAILERQEARQALLDDINAAGKVVRNFASPTPTGTSQEEDGGIAYRKAFMDYVQRGIDIPMELRGNENTKTSDVGVTIPQNVLNRIVEKMEATGMILNAVTRTAYKGGLTIPTSSVKPTASWVNEGAGSDKQKKTVAGTLTFAYHKLRCAVSVSLEVETMALSAFENTLSSNVAEAMLKALEQSIISGNGSGKPKGILAETPVSGQALEILSSGTLSYQTLTEAEAALPLAYEAGAVWLMTKKTFMAFVGMVDGSGNPIARVDHGISGTVERTLLGRTVILNDYMDSYAASVESDTIFAALFNMKDYVLNTNLNMTMKKYEDNDTDDWITKAIMLADGKVVDKNSLVTLTKKA